MKTINKKHILAGLLIAAAMAPASARAEWKGNFLVKFLGLAEWVECSKTLQDQTFTRITNLLQKSNSGSYLQRLWADFNVLNIMMRKNGCVGCTTACKTNCVRHDLIHLSWNPTRSNFKVFYNREGIPAVLEKIKSGEYDDQVDTWKQNTQMVKTDNNVSKGNMATVGGAQLPSQKEIAKILDGLSLSHFDEKTKFSQKLGGTHKTEAEVTNNNTAIYRCTTGINPNTTKALKAEFKNMLSKVVNLQKNAETYNINVATDLKNSYESWAGIFNACIMKFVGEESWNKYMLSGDGYTFKNLSSLKDHEILSLITDFEQIAEDLETTVNVTNGTQKQLETMQDDAKEKAKKYLNGVPETLKRCHADLNDLHGKLATIMQPKKLKE